MGKIKTIEGYVYNRIEKLGDKDYQHLGFEDDNKSFGELLEQIVPKVGMRKRVRITFEILDE